MKFFGQSKMRDKDVKKIVGEAIRTVGRCSSIRMRRKTCPKLTTKLQARKTFRELEQGRVSLWSISCKSEKYFNKSWNFRRISCAVLIPPKNRWWWQSNNLKKLKQWYKPMLYIQASNSSEKTRLNSQVHWIPCSWIESSPTTRQHKTKWECGVNRGMMCYLC